MSKSSMYLAILTIIFAPLTTIAQDFDPEAVSQVSKAIAEWKLMSDTEAEEQQVYVSSSLAGVVQKASSEGIGVVSGLTAFAGEYRPVRTAMNYYYRRADVILESIKHKPQFWFWKGMQASAYDLAGKYIDYFPFFDSLSIERHTVEVIDPMRKYTPLQRIGSVGGLSWDIASPFATSMIKTGGTKLLKRQANRALAAPDLRQFDKAVTQLYKSTVFMDRGIRTIDAIQKSSMAYAIGSDAFSLGSRSMRKFAIRPRDAATWKVSSIDTLQLPDRRFNSMPTMTNYPPWKVLSTIKDPLSTYRARVDTSLQQYYNRIGAGSSFYVPSYARPRTSYSTYSTIGQGR